jgi:hypothetical protein
MSYYHEGYNEARAWVTDESRTEEELLEQLDTLCGRENLSEGYTMEELRLEALDQTARDFTDYSSPQYQEVQFWGAIHKAGGLR